MGTKDLIILRGIPGSGKSTVADILAEGVFNHTICCADDYFTNDEGVYNWYPSGIKKAHEASQLKCREAMERGESRVIVANTNTTEKEMKPYNDMANEFGYRVISLIVENRANTTNIHNVPESTLKKMCDRFEIKLM